MLFSVFHNGFDYIQIPDMAVKQRILMVMRMMDMMKVPFMLLHKASWLIFFISFFQVIYPVDFKQTSHIVDDEMHTIMVNAVNNALS